jgi:hypothetical protein
VEQILPEVGVGGVAQIMYTHVSKCKNDKINKRTNKIGKYIRRSPLNRRVYLFFSQKNF